MWCSARHHSPLGGGPTATRSSSRWLEWLLGVSGDDFCQPPGHRGVGAGPRSPRAALDTLERAAARGSAPRAEAQLARRRRSLTRQSSFAVPSVVWEWLSATARPVD
jgi:hypothetical protein